VIGSIREVGRGEMSRVLYPGRDSSSSQENRNFLDRDPSVSKRAFEIMLFFLKKTNDKTCLERHSSPAQQIRNIQCSCSHPWGNYPSSWTVQKIYTRDIAMDDWNMPLQKIIRYYPPHGRLLPLKNTIPLNNSQKYHRPCLINPIPI